MISYRKGVSVVQDKRKVITIRVSPELKFQIDKAAAEDNRTINSWITHIIKLHLDGAKK
jgi:predicted HicB family RNase H-like nuclease